MKCKFGQAYHGQRAPGTAHDRTLHVLQAAANLGLALNDVVRKSMSFGFENLRLKKRQSHYSCTFREFTSSK